MNVYETGGSVDGVFYSYDYWVLAKFLWDRWNRDMTIDVWVPFDDLDSIIKGKVLDVAHDVLHKIREERLA